MMIWVSAAVAIVGAAWAVFTRSTRSAGLALWVCGLGVGGGMLSMGLEFVAITQWILSTLSVLGFSYFAVLLGEEPQEGSRGIYWKSKLAPLGIGVMFCALVWFAVGDVPENPKSPAAGISEIGRMVVTEHLVSLEVLGIAFLVVVIGAGVLSRSEVTRKESS